MKITFLGTGTSMGVPVAGGFWNLPSTDSRDQRYRTSCWVETESLSILIDCGPEFRLQTLRAGIKRLDLVLLTHEHADHIGGIDDLRPFNWHQQREIPVITIPACAKALQRRYPYMFGDEKTENSSSIRLMYGADSFDYLGERITLLPVDHQSVEVTGFRIRDFSYITDARYVPDETIEKIRGSKVLVLNALRWKPEHPTHMTIPQAIETARKAGAENTYFVHMNAQVNHAETQRMLPPGIHLAYDTLTVDI